MQRSKVPRHSRPPRNAWQLQSAKARFSELFRRARTEGPQWVTKHGGEAVVILPAEQFERLQARSQTRRGLKELLLSSPWRGANIEVQRSAEYGREIDL